MGVWHALLNRSSALCFGLLFEACGGSAPPPSPLQEKLRAGCSTHGECSMLWAEARARDQECRQARKEDCSRTAIDLEAAERLLAPYEALARRNIVREQAERDEEQARLREEQKARQAEYARLLAERDEGQRLAAEAAAAEKARRAQVREGTYRAMTPKERAQYLSDCFLIDAEMLHAARTKGPPRPARRARECEEGPFPAARTDTSAVLGQPWIDELSIKKLRFNERRKPGALLRRSRLAELWMRRRTRLLFASRWGLWVYG